MNKENPLHGLNFKDLLDLELTDELKEKIRLYKEGKGPCPEELKRKKFGKSDADISFPKKEDLPLIHSN